jgi:hypothetical protein
VRKPESEVEYLHSKYFTDYNIHFQSWAPFTKLPATMCPDDEDAPFRFIKKEDFGLPHIADWILFAKELFFPWFATENGRAHHFRDTFGYHWSILNLDIPRHTLPAIDFVVGDEHPAFDEWRREVMAYRAY